jgi:xanthine dehydrogenase accessory factor
MTFDLDELRRAVHDHGRVARVVVAEVAGSAPREVGAAMLVWPTGQSGTIGGGALEYEAAKAAFVRNGLTRHPLGPELGQCCGGAVTLLTEHYDARSLPTLDARSVIARGPGDMPLAVKRVLDRARARGEKTDPALLNGWMVETISPPKHPVWIWGAGHVGRALIDVLAPVPEISLTWIDTGPDRFPAQIPDGVHKLPTPVPATAMPLAPRQAAHLVLTYSHEIDLALCHAALSHGFGFCGLIGSVTKWARFRKRLRMLGHTDAQIDAICCPIGQKAFGKHPQAIAISTASQLLTLQTEKINAWPTHSSASTA